MGVRPGERFTEAVRGKRHSGVMARSHASKALLEKLRQRGQWSEADARKIITALERSEQSVTAFAAEHELMANRLYYWRSRMADAAAEDVPDDVSELSFAPVVLTGQGHRPAVTVRLGALEVDVFEPEQLEPSWLAKLCAAITTEVA